MWARHLGERRAAALALVVLWALFFGRQIFGNGFPFYRDNLVTYVPLQQYLRARFLAGELPQWYPYESLGVPLVGQIATGIFHPLTWLLLPLAPLAGLKWMILLTYLAALLGAYRLARSLGNSRNASVTAAVAFGFGGYALGVSNVIFYLLGAATLAWFTWAALRVVRNGRWKDVALLACMSWLLFLSADLVSLLTCPLFALIALLQGERRVRAGVQLALGGLTGLLLSGVELVPSLLLGRDSARVLGIPSLGFSWALHPWRLPELLFPGFIPDPVRYRITGEVFHDGTAVFATSIFAGGITLCLAGLGVAAWRRKALPWVCLTFLGLWLALGDTGGLLPLAKHLVFPLRYLRYPEKFLVVSCTAMVPLVAAGVDACLRHRRRAVVTFSALAIFAGLLSSVIAGWGAAHVVWRWTGNAAGPDTSTAELIDDAWRGGALWTALFAGLAAVTVAVSARASRAWFALPVLAFLELLHGNGHHFPLLPSTLMSTPNPFAEAIRRGAPPEAPLPRVTREVEVRVPLTPTGAQNAEWVEANRLVLKPDLSGWEGIPSLGENLGGTSARHQLLFGVKAALAPRYAALFNGCERITDLRRPPRPDERTLAESERFGWRLLASPCWPRAFLAGVAPVPDARTAVQAISAGQVTQERVVWEGGPPLEHAAGLVRWVRDAPEHVELLVNASAPTALVLTDQATPGWTATVDGRATPIHTTLVVARGVVVPAGQHRVEFRYRTPGLVVGTVLSAVGFVLALGMWAAEVGARRRQRARSETVAARTARAS